MSFCKQCGHADKSASAKTLRRTSRDAEDLRAHLELDLTQIDTALEELSRKKLSLKRQLNSFSPIFKLPTELAVEIFMATFPEDSWHTWGSDTPLLFGSICHAWRDLAWSHPRLWSTISLTMSRYSDTNTTLLREWIERSGNLPLFIRLKMIHPMVHLPDHGQMLTHRPLVDPHAVQVLKVLACYSERWQVIDFHLFIYPKDCFNILPTNFPLLQSISLSLAQPEPVEGSLSSQIKPLFWVVPRLRSISLDPSSMKYVELPMEQITYISFNKTAEVGVCLGALQASPHVVCCVFPSVTSRFRPTHRPTVTAGHLKSLDVEFSPYRASLAFPSLFDNLKSPSLQDLSLSITAAGGTILNTSLVSFLFRSACPLVRLSLSRIRLSGTELERCLAIIPSLVELRLEEMELSSQTLHNLTLYPHSTDTLLPSLQSFTYIGESEVDFSALSSMAVSRWYIGTTASEVEEPHERAGKLKFIFVDVRGNRRGAELPNAVVSQLGQLRNEGLDIEILYFVREPSQQHSPSAISTL
jgi:hypothetical protein